MQSNDLLDGFPAGYFLIKAANPGNHGRGMLLDISRSERQPGIELMLWADETQSLWPFGKDWNDFQVFFVSQDGILRSKATGHPIGCMFDDKSDTLKLITQLPCPFNHRSQPRCRFSYDLPSKSIRMRLADETNVDQSCGLTRWDTSDSGICVSVTGDDISPRNTEPYHVLEFVPKGHRYRQISQVFNGALESPGQEACYQKPSNNIAPQPASEPIAGQVDVDDSWNKGREVRMVRPLRYTTRFQEWDIIPLGSPSCDDLDDEWTVVD